MIQLLHIIFALTSCTGDVLGPVPNRHLLDIRQLAEYTHYTERRSEAWS